MTRESEANKKKPAASVDDFYVPIEYRKQAVEEEPSDSYEEGAMQVFGLGPTRLDLSESQAKSSLTKYQTQPERVVNALVVAARKLYLEDKPMTVKNILAEWDTSINVTAPSEQFVQDFIATREFKDKLRLIGVKKNPSDEGLSAVQHAVISSLTFPDGKPLHMKLKKHRIPWVTFQGWLKDPNFLRYLKLNAEQALDAAEAFTLINLVRLASNGNNSNAMNTVLAMTNRWDPNKKQLDSQQAVQLILQVLDEEIKDPELKDRIGSRLSILSSNSSTLKGELT